MAPASVDDPEHHNHDGFYLRLSLPLGLQLARFQFEGDSGRRDFSASGLARGFALRIGGTPRDGLAIGVQGYSSRVQQNDVWLPSQEPVSGEPPPPNERGSAVIRTALLGFFVDYFPDPRDNFHLGLSLGIATNTIEHDYSDPEYDQAGGLGASLWVGHGWWISKNWSVAGVGQAVASFGDNKVMSARALALVGMLSLLYH